MSYKEARDRYGIYILLTLLAILIISLLPNGIGIANV